MPGWEGLQGPGSGAAVVAVAVWWGCSARRCREV